MSICLFFVFIIKHIIINLIRIRVYNRIPNITKTRKGYMDGKLVQGLKIESWQPQYRNFNSNEDWFIVGTSTGPLS